MKKAGRLAAAVFAAMLLVTGCGAPAEKKAVETTPEQSSKIEQKEEAKNLKDAFKKDFKVGVAINPYQLKDEETKKIILENFNSITMENGGRRKTAKTACRRLMRKIWRSVFHLQKITALCFVVTALSGTIRRRNGFSVKNTMQEMPK